ncbi:MAG: hypothetical protein ABSF12_18080 [Bryobacteraceae bacterium]
MPNMKMRGLSFLGFVCSATLAVSPALQGQPGDPVVFSVYTSADYGTAIAQGSLFVVFGYALGPSTLVEVSAFPLPNVLSGTSVTVTAGSTTLNCPMVYTSDGQVAAILPSNTPVGLVTIAVSYNGLTNPYSSTTRVLAVESSLGIFTTTSNGLGAGIFTALDGTLKTLADSAKPGDIVTAWATGIGPISSPDNQLPTSFPNFPNVQVWVGGQPAQIVYAGRSGCCGGVDQVDFYVPAIANGCNVPVNIVSGGNSSNTVALSVNGSGGPCSDSGPTPPASTLTTAAAGQPVRVAAIGIGPTALGNRSAFTASAAKRLSAALHTPVPEADVARLMRAYATGNPRAIRLAMAKYASKWKALDAKTKIRLTAQLGQAQEGVVAEFGSFANEGLVAIIGSAQLPVPGSCVVLPHTYPTGLGSRSAGLDAGASLSLTGPAGPFTLAETAKGHYHALFAPSLTGPNIPLGTYTITGSGGKDVGAFSAAITVANHLAISNKSSLATVDRTQPLTLNWTGGVAGSYVLIAGYTPSGIANNVFVPSSYFACAEDGGKGTFTIPVYILSTMNATANGNAVLLILPNPLSNQIVIPGIDLAYFLDGSSDSANVTFQ